MPPARGLSLPPVKRQTPLPPRCRACCSNSITDTPQMNFSAAAKNCSTVPAKESIRCWKNIFPTRQRSKSVQENSPDFCNLDIFSAKNDKKNGFFWINKEFGIEKLFFSLIVVSVRGQICSGSYTQFLLFIITPLSVWAADLEHFFCKDMI